MANKLREGAGSLALAVAENACHRDFEIIVQNRQRYAAEKGKCRDVPVKKSFRRLRRIGLDEAGVRMRQVEAEHMQLHPYAADDANAFAEVDLRMARRMGQRHEDLARPAAGDPNVILHYGITAGKTVFEPQPFENPLRGVPLLRRCRLVGLQDRVDDRYEQSKLRPLRRLGSHIAGRRRIAAHLGNRVSAQSENPRRLAPALPFDEDKPSNRCVNLHREHPRPSLFESDFEKVRQVTARGSLTRSMNPIEGRFPGGWNGDTNVDDFSPPGRQRRSPLSLSKIDQSIAIVVEAEQNPNRANFPLKSKARNFDGSVIGF